ncbi:MAG: bifunctional metallophosphatase/5'-nucleotidase [Ignavibacteria bacterium]|nr:bifunctional metallophosphatase/5'-nucleotidase [Ignavibacteria bacterium]
MKKIKFQITAFLFLTFSTYAQQSELTILHWNDFHARNQPYVVSKKDSAGNEVTYKVGGVGSMLGYVEKYRDSKSLVLNAGDDFQGTPISSFTRGRSQIEFLNFYSPDAFVLGNHEFDYSHKSLDSALKLAKFDVLSANVYLPSEKRLFAKPYVIKEKNGIKTGIIGITLPELFETSLPANVEGLQMLKTDSVIEAAVKVLKKNKCDLIILLTHCGIETDRKLAARFFKDVDVIVGGHSHTPLFKPVIQDGVIIVQAGSNARYLGILELSVDKEKDTVISYKGRLVETIYDENIYDKDAGEKVDRMIQEYLPELSRVIGLLETDWKASYSEESNLGQFEADVFRIKSGADVAFMNGGGLRKSLLKGNITVQDIWEINPFGNEIVVCEVSGKTLKQMIRNNILIRLEKIKSGSNAEILHTSGLSYSYSSKLALEGREDFLMSFNFGRVEVNDDEIYKIATNNYVASQFKKFFGDINPQPEFRNTGMIDRDIIIEAVSELGVINSVLEKRIVDIDK